MLGCLKAQHRRASPCIFSLESGRALKPMRKGQATTFVGVDGSPEASAQGGQAALICPIVQVSIRQLVQVDTPPLVPRCLTWLYG